MVLSCTWYLLKTVKPSSFGNVGLDWNPREILVGNAYFPGSSTTQTFFCWGNSHLFFSQSWVKPGLVKSQHLLQEISKDLPMSQHLLGFQTLPNFTQEISTSPTAAPLWRSPSGDGFSCRIRLSQIQGDLKWKVITKTYLTNSNL